MSGRKPGVYRRVVRQHVLSAPRMPLEPLAGGRYVAILDVCGHAVIATGRAHGRRSSSHHCAICTRKRDAERPATEKRAKVIDLLKVIGGPKATRAELDDLADRLLTMRSA